MSYIDKNSNIVISARMTNEGRKLLSLGLLNFDTFRLGDSEIDYLTLGTSYDVSLENILRAKAENPDIKTALKPTPTATNNYQSIPELTPVILNTLINAPKTGFFQYGSGTTIEYTAYTDTICHVLQSDTIIPISGITGGTNISVLQAPTYGSNTYEPKIGDLMLVKMTNDEITTPQNNSVVELNTPVPYLWYKVQGVNGSLSTNTLQIEIDRNFASFPSYMGSNYCWATFYPLGTGTTSDYLFSENGFFSGGCVWNMNNVWTYPMIGVSPAIYENFNNYGSENYVGTKEFLGYTSEPFITNTGTTLACSIIPSVSLIHYSNKDTCENQTELKYGQKFHVDLSVPESPKLILPTLMWHKDFSATTIGQVFTTSGETGYVKLSGRTPYTVSSSSTNMEKNIYYMPLIDKYGNKVGRTYPELQIFSIDDQELVAALSYKSNRNWTLPTHEIDTVSNTDGIIDGTNILYVTYLLASTSGYTTGLHQQNFKCITTTSQNQNCPPTLKQSVEFQLPPGELPFMKVSGGTGWYADKFYILAQKTQIGTLPDPSSWVLMDFTSEITGHVVGNRINPVNLEATTFNITQTKYNNGVVYNLNNFIKIPQIAETEKLQFGDERFLFGNIEAVGVTKKYRTKFNFTIPPNFYNTSTNPSWPNSQQRTHISEIGVYDVNKNLVAIGKMNYPIEKLSNATIIVEIAFDL